LSSFRSLCESSLDADEAGPRFFGIPAVFAVFAGNYQRAIASSRQKTWSAGGAASQKTARIPLLLTDKVES
jgi:hypothetical protein